MQRGIILAAGLTALAGLASATPASADEWCGYTTKDNAVIECGYTSAQNCEAAVDKDGKGGMCFVDPDNAFNIVRPPRPASPLKSAASG
jgi:Protein of unknown function (DUF3551)